MKYIITSAFDPNHSFEVEADTVAEAASLALGELGWGVALTDNDETETEED